MALDGAWSGDVRILENSCSMERLDDVESWFVNRSGTRISIFFSHREYEGTLVANRFETRRTPQTSFCGLYIRTEDCLGLDATLVGEAEGDRVNATEIVVQTNAGGVMCRTVREFDMIRPALPSALARP